MLSKMTKENLELLSYTKIAEMYLKENKKTMNTADLFREICKLLGLGDEEYQEKIGDFFESLTTSKDFILLNDGNWDLKANHSVKIDIDDIYEESDSGDEEEDPSDDELSEEDNYEDDNYDNDASDDDIIDDDYADLTIVDDEELEEN
ncbi:MAG: DNA-directed RNA polymerase subunit delta [Bacilli bacterium]